jgi:hypothetical protein
LTTEQRQQYRAIGSRLAVYLRERGHELPSRQILQALASDLAAEHNELALPLTDLLLRPAFRQLVAKAGSGRGSLESQALLQSMQNTFAPVIIDALREILFGFIDLPTNPTPHVTETTVNRAAINPKYSEPYVNRGFAKNALGDKQGAIARDVVILWVLTFMGGFVVRVAGASPGTPLFMEALFVSNTIFSILGFTISGWLVGGRRWKHLLVVALLVWLTGLINLFFGFTFIEWLGSIVALLVFMAIGGGLSYLFRK